MAERGRKKENAGSFALLIILLFFLAIIDISALIVLKSGSKSSSSSSSGTETAKVTDIISGDTIKLDSGKYVKLIGISAPSSGAPYYDESKNMLKFLLLNKQVELEKDVDDTDSSGNLLRYVYVDWNGQRLLVNAESARQGFALPQSISPDTKHSAEISSAYQECLSNHLFLCA